MIFTTAEIYITEQTREKFQWLYSTIHWKTIEDKSIVHKLTMVHEIIHSSKNIHLVIIYCLILDMN